MDLSKTHKDNTPKVDTCALCYINPVQYMGHNWDILRCYCFNCGVIVNAHRLIETSRYE